MEFHAAAGKAASERVAGEVRAELARQRKTGSEVAALLGIAKHTAGRRLSGEVPFDVLELAQVSLWLGVPIEHFLATEKASA